MKIALALSSLMWSCAPLPAQRVWSYASFFDQAGQRVFLSHESLPEAKWVWTIGAVTSSGTLAFPPGMLGSAAPVDSSRLLVSGGDGTQGWLGEIGFSITGSEVVPTFSAIPTGIDVVKMVYVPAAGLVIGINHGTNELVAALYSAGPSLTPWQVIVTPAQCPLLSLQSFFLKLRASPTGVGVTVESLEPYVGVGYTVTRDPTGVWTVEGGSSLSAPVTLPPTWVASAYPVLALNSTQYDLWIGGGDGYFQIVDETTGVSVFAGFHNGDPSGQVFSIPHHMLITGRRYRVESMSGNAFDASLPFIAENVWLAASVDPHMVPSRVGIRWDFPTVGTDFVSWEIYWRSPAPQPVDPMLLLMTVGAWDFGYHPTVPALGVEVLAVPYGDLGVQVGNWENRGYVSFGWAVSVNNPVLSGLKVAMQAVGLLPTGQFVASDVVGVHLVP